MAVNSTPGKVDVCNSCAMKSDGAGMTAGGQLEWGNNDYNNGKLRGARGSYQDALNILEQKNACSSCINAVRQAYNRV